MDRKLGLNPFISTPAASPASRRGPGPHPAPPRHGQQSLATPDGLHGRMPSAGQAPPRQPMNFGGHPGESAHASTRRVIEMQHLQMAHSTAVAMAVENAAQSASYEQRLDAAMAILDLSVQHAHEMEAAMAPLHQPHGPSLFGHGHAMPTATIPLAHSLSYEHALAATHDEMGQRLSYEHAMTAARFSMNDLSYESAMGQASAATHKLSYESVMAEAKASTNDLSYDSAMADAQAMLGNRLSFEQIAQATEAMLPDQGYEHSLSMATHLSWTFTQHD
jgi:hypothetical protein